MRPMPAPQTLTINEATLREIVASREALLGTLDAKRPKAWTQYGYRETLTFQDFLNAYKRGGAGHGAVHRLLDKCWQEHPRIKAKTSDTESTWEEGVEDLLDSINGWAKLRDLDRRNMVGRYAGLILRVADGKKLDQPLVAGKWKLRDIVPVYEDQLRVSAWQNDQEAEDFGQPTMWEYRMRRPTATSGDQQAAPDSWAQVHPSRLIIMAEGSVGDFLDGVPLLEAGFNHLTDLEKIAGGSAESFLKNSSRTLVFKFDANSAPTLLSNNPEGTQSTRPLSEVLEEKSQALNTSIDASVATAGGEVSTLQTTVADPGPSFEVAANLFAASVQIPFTILFGQQTGRLASDQDRQDFAARCASRQENELTPVLIAVVKRLQDAGIIEAQDFEIEWPRVDAPSEKDRVEILGKMAAASKTNFDAGGGPLFTVDELRKVVDYEAQTDGEHPPTEGDPDATLTSDPAAGPGGALAPQPRALRQAA